MSTEQSIDFESNGDIGSNTNTHILYLK